MAQTLVAIYMHVVFSTKHRQPFITPDVEPDLYRYMNGIARSLNSPCLAINGTENHTHLLVSPSKNLPLSDLLCQIKASSTKWVKARDTGRHQSFGCQDGYGAFSVSRTSIPAVVEYIANQKEHHRRTSFEDEFRAMLRKSAIDFDERYLFD